MLRTNYLIGRLNGRKVFIGLDFYSLVDKNGIPVLPSETVSVSPSGYTNPPVQMTVYRGVSQGGYPFSYCPAAGTEAFQWVDEEGRPDPFLYRSREEWKSAMINALRQRLKAHGGCLCS